MASMALSNKTLSGCFDPTLASGLTDFLFVQATVITSSVPNTIINGIRRDISTSIDSCRTAALGVRRAKLGFLDSLYSKPHWLRRHGFPQTMTRPSASPLPWPPSTSLRILSWIAIAEHGVARHQNFCSRPHHIGRRSPAPRRHPPRCGNATRAGLRISANCRILCSVDGMNFCAPNPGFTDITST